LRMVGESTYRRGLEYSEDLSEQVDILRQAGAEAVISVGSYAACAAFIRDARDAGWNVPIANLSFVGSESLLVLLKEEGGRAGKDYTGSLVISQVVPSYEATALPAVREYRALMAKQEGVVPSEYAGEGYSPPVLSSVSFEGYLSAKLLVEILDRMGDPPLRSRLSETIEGIRNLDLGIGTPVSFGPNRHQGMDTVYYVTVKDGKLTPEVDWSALIP
ncbi:MAG: ABC transporter substrate-binding protein, partial [bacterium]|nr:ABC transporter substrate-binding protein [bacterium]